MNIYIKYFKYVCEHKKNVFKECIKVSKKYSNKTKIRLIIHAFTHDLSKLNPKEFIPYAKWFYGVDGIKLEKMYNTEQITNGLSCISRSYLECKSNFDYAWRHHFMCNKHHWNYWCNYDYKDENIISCRAMDNLSILEMICDWNAMGKKFNDTAMEFYLKNYKKMKLHKTTILHLETNLYLLK